MNEYFRMNVPPGRLVFGRPVDYLVFERIYDFPASGWFAAVSDAWDLPRLCQVVPAANVRPFDGRPRYVTETGEPLPEDALPMGKLVRGCIEFDRADREGA